MSVEELTNELDKADAEFKSKAHFQRRPLTTQYQPNAPNTQASEANSVPKPPVSNYHQKEQPKWRSIDETGGFREVKEEPEYIEENIPHNEPLPELSHEIKEEIPYDIPEPAQVIVKPVIEEKIVTLGSSNKKTKSIAFKKRKIDPSQQKFKERKLDDD